MGCASLTITQKRYNLVITQRCGSIYVPPKFKGDLVPTLYIEAEVAMAPKDYSGYFDPVGDSYELIGDQPDGLSISSAGILSGTPTPEGLSEDAQVKAATDSVVTARSNKFDIDVYEAGLKIMLPLLLNRYGLNSALASATLDRNSPSSIVDDGANVVATLANEFGFDGARRDDAQALNDSANSVSNIPVLYFEEAATLSGLYIGDASNPRNNGVADDCNVTMLSATNDLLFRCEWTPDLINSCVLFETGDIKLAWSANVISFSKGVFSATSALTPVQGVTYVVQGRLSATLGVDIFVETVSGSGDGDVSAATPSTVLSIGSDEGGGSHINGNLKHLSVYAGDYNDDETYMLGNRDPWNGLTLDFEALNGEPSVQRGAGVLTTDWASGGYLWNAETGAFNFIAPNKPAWRSDGELQYYTELGNLLIHSNNLGQWVIGDSSTTIVSFDQVGLDGRDNSASLLTDVGTGIEDHEAASAYQQITIPADTGKYTSRVWIKKDDNEVRFPMVRVEYGATDYDTYLNTKTGEFYTVGSFDYVEVLAVGEWWLVLVRSQNNGTSTTLKVSVFAAASDTWDTSNFTTNEITGSIIVGNVETVGQSAGRDDASLLHPPIISGATAFTMNRTKYTLSASEHDQTNGIWVCDMRTNNPANSTFGLVSGTSGYTGILYFSITIKSWDSATTATYFAAIADDELKRVYMVYHAADAKFTVGAADDGISADSAYDGDFTLGSEIELFAAGEVVASMGNLRRYSITSQTQGRAFALAGFPRLEGELRDGYTFVMKVGSFGTNYGFTGSGTLAPEWYRDLRMWKMEINSSGQFYFEEYDEYNIGANSIILTFDDQPPHTVSSSGISYGTYYSDINDLDLLAYIQSMEGKNMQVKMEPVWIDDMEVTIQQASNEVYGYPNPDYWHGYLLDRFGVANGLGFTNDRCNIKINNSLSLNIVVQEDGAILEYDGQTDAIAGNFALHSGTYNKLVAVVGETITFHLSYAAG